MNICAPVIQKGKRVNPVGCRAVGWDVLTSKSMGRCAHSQKIWFESKVWSWTGVGTKQKFGGLVHTFRTKVVCNRSNQREDGHAGVFLIVPLY